MHPFGLIRQSTLPLMQWRVLGTCQHVVMSPDKDEDGKRATLEKTVEYELIREEPHEVCITFWSKAGDDKVGTPMLYMTKSGKWMHRIALKPSPARISGYP
ncbi:MAG: hypothetical protein COC12_07595 [Rhodobacteraceae bacterium]|nr:MAG: hypothetical protein COC12_07595 [Paracoccaceae bacterium]